MKTCTACGETKPLTEFYTRHNKCKACTCAAVRANRAAKLEQYREYDRNRAFREDRVAARQAYQKAMQSNKEMAARQAVRVKKWQDKNAVKRRAHVMLGNAVRDGHVHRPTACERCGVEGHLNGHHENYYKPLEVVWLCNTCHGIRHQEINEQKRAGRDLSCRGF